jgi:hypothetical protein
LFLPNTCKPRIAGILTNVYFPYEYHTEVISSGEHSGEQENIDSASASGTLSGSGSGSSSEHVREQDIDWKECKYR